MKILSMLILWFWLSVATASTAVAGTVASCVTGGIIGSSLGWLTAILLVPFTGGTSLAAAPTLDYVIAGGVAGCVLSATGAEAGTAVETWIAGS